MRLSKRFQILDQLGLLLRGEVQVLGRVVVVHDREEIGEAPIVVESALFARKKTAKRCRAIAPIGGSRGLEIIDADFACGVHRPAWFAEQGRDMTGRTGALALEY